MTDYKIERLCEKNIRHLYTLAKSVYGKKFPDPYFHLKYNTSYIGIQHVGFIAFYNNQPVAYYGVIPVGCSIKGERVIGAQSCDTMTLPGHRRRGLFVWLATLTFELATQLGIHFVFGFPNQNSYPGFIKKLNFSNQETMVCYTFCFKDNLYKKVYRKLAPIFLHKKKSSILNILLSLNYDGIIYDRPYLKYKEYSDSFIAMPSGEPVWLKTGHVSWIGAVSAFAKSDIEKLMSALDKKWKPATFTFMISPGVTRSFDLKEIEKKEGFAVIVKNLSRKYDLSNLKFQFADVDVF